MLEMVIFALAGYLLVRFKVIKHDGLEAVSRIIINCALPLFIFHKLVTRFDFATFANWWAFPLLSFAIIAVGFALGFFFCGLFKVQHKREFISLITFQNSGYLPLALVSVLLSGQQQETMFVYIFLFLLGFNLLIWSFGMCMLSKTCDIKDKNTLKKLVSPPVIATIFSLILVFFGINKFLPQSLLVPLKSIGDTTIPLALLVLGGNLAFIEFKKAFNKESMLVVLTKLFIMPALALIFLNFVELPRLIGLLIVIQMAVPSATSLAVISRRYALEDRLISNTIMLTHLFCIVSLPLFLSIYEKIIPFKA